MMPCPSAYLLLIVQGGLRMFRRKKVGVRFANRLQRIIEFKLFRHGPADPDEPAFFRPEINSVRQIFEQRVEKIALMRQRFLGALRSSA